ncbi:uncharacterized protein LOC128736541 [Sabethes cyaneus]|uniref:uncharacterized protein LOC128736541 n=1 Tax=Sabethes cyaneus TaxID=53552 RepID=UPI00237EC09D|nr:uncharacterized protein LOC128736541 [Sabethes cyaneus]
MATSDGRPESVPADHEGCVACDNPDADHNYVQCDLCDRWWHFACAGVTDSINDRAWICSHCSTLPPAKPSSPIPSSNNSTAGVQRNLALLKQRQELELQRMEHQLKQKFLDEQLEVINQAMKTSQQESRHDEAAPSTDRNNRNNDAMDKGDVCDQQKPATPLTSVNKQSDNVVSMIRDLESNLERLQLQPAPSSQALDDLRQQLEQCKVHLGLHPTEFRISPTVGRPEIIFPNPSGEPRSSYQQQRSLGAIKKNYVTGNSHAMGDVGNNYTYESVFHNKPCVNAPHKSSTIPATTISASVREQQRDAFGFCEFEQNFPSARQQQRAPVFSDDQQREHFARSANGNIQSTPLAGRISQQQHVNIGQNGPTPQQIAARQSLARDLPQFSGDPAEWPIFIANYEYTTAACGYTLGENMLRLQRCLKGPALETVRSRLVLPGTVPQVIEALRRRYGRSELLINALLEKVRRIPAPKSEKLEGLIDYGMAVQALCDHMVAANEHVHLTNPMLLQELVGKLPPNQKLSWAAYKRKCGDEVNLKTFSSFMEDIVSDASSVVLLEPESYRGKDKLRSRGYVNSHTETNLEQSLAVVRQIDCNLCGKAGHRLRDCSTFKNLSVDDRWRKVRALSLCQNCLFNHGRRACRSRNRCTVDSCQYRHHPLLHSTRRTTAANVQSSPAESLTHQSLGSSVLFRVVPVTLYGRTGEVNTYAFLDEGSSLTLMDSEIADQLRVSGTVQPLCLRWTGNTSRVEANSKVVTITIKGAGSQRRFQMLNVRTVPSLNLPSQTFQREIAAEQFGHLKQLPLQSYKNAVPKLLIGVEHLHLAVPLKVREGNGKGPIAVKTRLGWCVYGRQQPGERSLCNLHVCECNYDRELHDAVKRFYDLEETGTGSAALLTRDERRALDLLEQTTVRVGQKFETALLWKDDHVELPDSYLMALRRLECLERKMSRDTKLKENVHRLMQEFVDKGYIHKAKKEELDAADPRRIWYLPIGAVTNPKKPEKTRIVWDAAAKTDGVSLNSMLLKGPDQLVSLLGVLFRFRQFKVAVSSDVKEMFLQISMRECDKHSQRILWRTDPLQSADIFLVDVATFGSTCSPASAQFVKNKNAREHGKEYPRAAEGILQSTYVDDYLDSFGSEEEASRVAAEVRLIFRNGGFVLRNWISNNDGVLKHLGEKQAATSKSLITTSTNCERVLGMLWNPLTDELSFSTRMSDEVQTLLENDDKPTKRQVLRCVMTLFDPLGLLATFLIHGKILVQDLWRAGTGWDEEVAENQYRDWCRWIKMIAFIARIRIPRCYFPEASAKTYEQAELHVFVDASLLAYACALYLRTTCSDGTFQCSLIAAKAKVAPLKPITIPKLELQGCILGARMAKFVQANHTISISRRILWTDSSVALSWIRADPRNYRPFVANRVGEILETTTVDEWRWVPTESNPADEATKWGSGPYFGNSMWYNGPEFLRQPETTWPNFMDTTVSTTEEIRASILFHVTWEPLVTYDRFSKWERLQRSMSYVLRFLHNARSKGNRRGGQLSQFELEAAEIEIWKQIQIEVYPDEVTTLQKNLELPEEKRKPIDRCSSLYQLVPTLDERGLMRQCSRIASAKHIQHTVRYPIILPRKHRCTMLLVAKYHRVYRHANAETVVNEIRQLFVIPKLRTLVREVGRNCEWCKIRRAQPVVPPMAPLPHSRLAVYDRPFSYVGLDYFGPLTIKQGRASVKRWVALFTCLTVRAVHLEIVHNLTSFSCVSSIRRFVNRRGSPVEIFSDNATNFHGAERMLREQINQQCAVTFTSSNTKWTFIPPAAPHMGGAWERLVRSVKTAISEAYTEGKLTDEDLHTLIVEAEGIVNRRPLTYLPLDSAESEALTPNHFIMGSSSGAKQPLANINHQNGTSRESWDQIRRHLDRFWQRWLKEYLPVLRKQTKWFDEARRVETGDIVLITDEGKRNTWIRGRVIETISAADGRVRQAVIKTEGGVLRRPVSRLAVLDVGVNRATPGTMGPHPGENVATGPSSNRSTMGTLSPDSRS